MDRLWGEFLPVPEARLHVLKGGESLFNGGFEVAYTPGHASHHVCYLRGRTAFVGDTGGVRIMPESLTIPPTPPPDIDLDAWHESISRIGAWRPERIVMTHFGASTDVDRQLAEVGERLDELAAQAASTDLETFTAEIRELISRRATPQAAGAYIQAAPLEQIYQGLERYLRTRGESGSHPRGSAVS